MAQTLTQEDIDAIAAAILVDPTRKLAIDLNGAVKATDASGNALGTVDHLRALLLKNYVGDGVADLNSDFGDYDPAYQSFQAIADSTSASKSLTADNADQLLVAVGAAVAGDIITCGQGTFDVTSAGGITIPAGVKLRGAGVGMTKIIGTASSAQNYHLIIAQLGCEISDLSVAADPASPSNVASGIGLTGAADTPLVGAKTVLRNLHASGSEIGIDFAFRLSSAADLYVENVYAYGATTGFKFANTTNELTALRMFWSHCQFIGRGGSGAEHNAIGADIIGAGIEIWSYDTVCDGTGASGYNFGVALGGTKPNAGSTLHAFGGRWKSGGSANSWDIMTTIAAPARNPSVHLVETHGTAWSTRYTDDDDDSTATIYSAPDVAAIEAAVIANGNGAYARVFHVTDGEGTDLEGVTVRATEGADSPNGKTNASGNVTLYLDAKTYALAARVSGYQLSTPTSITVAAAGTTEVEMTANGSPGASDPPLCTAWVDCFDDDYELASGIVIELSLVSTKDATAGQSFSRSDLSITSGEDGRASKSILRNSTYTARRLPNGVWITPFDIGDVATFALPEILGKPHG